MEVDKDGIDGDIAKAVAAWRQPGLAVAVTDRERTIYQRGFGVRHQGKGGLVDEHTIFAIASCSKPFAAASIALLVDEGRLAWDSKVIDHLPELRLYDDRVTSELTIRDLLCMRAGIRSGENRHRRLCTDRVDYISRLRYHEPIHAFREQFSYWTDGFTILGELVSRVTGQPWATYADNRIWQPLGMTRTNANYRAANLDENCAAPHALIAGQLRPIPWVYEDHVGTPAGGVNTSINDVAIWLRFILCGGLWEGQRLLSADVVREMLTPHTAIYGKFAEGEFSNVVGEGVEGIRFQSYALGWYVHDYRGHTVIYHTGKINGFQAVTGLLPDDGVGIAVLINSSQYLMQVGIFQSIVDRLLGVDGEDWCTEFLEQKDRMARVDAEAEQRLRVAKSAEMSVLRPLQQYAGIYIDQGLYGRLVLRVEGEQLVASCGTGAFRLFHWCEDVFEVYWQAVQPACRDGFVRFFVSEKGCVDSLEWSDSTAFRKIESVDND